MQLQFRIHARDRHRCLVFNLPKTQLLWVCRNTFKPAHDSAIAAHPAVELLVGGIDHLAQFLKRLGVVHSQLGATQGDGAVLQVVADAVQQLLAVGQLATWHININALFAGLLVIDNRRGRMHEAAQEFGFFLQGYVRAEQVEGQLRHINLVDTGSGVQLLA